MNSNFVNFIFKFLNLNRNYFKFFLAILISLFFGSSITLSSGYYNTGFAKRPQKICPTPLAGNNNFGTDPAGTLSFAISGWCIRSFDADPSAYMSLIWAYPMATPFNYSGIATATTSSLRFYSGTKSLYSYAKVNFGDNSPTTNSRLATNEIYTLPQFPGGTTQFHVWLSSVTYTTSSRWSYSISALLYDGTNTQTSILTCRDWALQEGCVGDFQNNSDLSATGADGQTWYRYTVTIPGGMNLSTLQLKIRHTQNAWDFTSADSSVYIGYVGL